MKFHIILALSLMLGGMTVALPSWASSPACPRHTAPDASFKNPSPPWGPRQSDSGVVIDGFADLAGYNDVLHGVDLSVFNAVKYSRILECGGKFSFIRVDKMFDAHAAELRQHGITVMPYFYMRIPEERRRVALFGGEDLRNLETYDRIGAAEATRFLKLHPNLQHVEIGGLKGQLIALDIEDRLLDEKPGDLAPGRHYGRAYAKAVCSWIAAVKREYKNLKVVLYTTPSVYGDYLDYAYPVEQACLQQLPIWLSRTTSNGGDVLQTTKRTADLHVQRICLIAGGNRCIFHQYTHRAIFAATGAPFEGQPPHMDLNRFFPVREVTSGLGIHYVRAN